MSLSTYYYILLQFFFIFTLLLFFSVLPAPKAPASLAPEEEEDAMEVEQEEFEAPKNIAPPYGQRQNWIPRHVEDYGDGGAFPEIHVAQYPLEMGRKGRGAMSTSVSLSLGADGKVQYDAILGKHSGALTVPKKNTDLIALGHSEAELAKPSDEVQTLLLLDFYTLRKLKKQQ